MKPSEEINQLKAQREAGKQHEHGVQELLGQRIYGLVHF
jgi:hypothetical protein